MYNAIYGLICDGQSRWCGYFFLFCFQGLEESQDQRTTSNPKDLFFCTVMYLLHMIL